MALARVLRGEEVRDLEVVIRRFDQQWKRTFNYGGTLVKDEQGQPMLAVVSMLNERHHQAQAIRR